MDELMTKLRILYSLEVETSVVVNHEAQLKAWRETRGIRAVEPPATPINFIEGSTA